MSDTEAPAEKPKKKKKKLILIGALLVLAGGGGAGFYASQSLIGGHPAEAKEEGPEQPKLKLREDADEDAAEAWEAHNKGKEPDSKLFQASYFPLKDSFTANLSNSDSFLQVGLGVSTYYDEPELKRVETHEMAIRSAILMVLSNQEMETVTTEPGRDALQKQLKDAVNKVLEQKEGFGGIDDVYFTSFVVQ